MIVEEMVKVKRENINGKMNRNPRREGKRNVGMEVKIREMDCAIPKAVAARGTERRDAKRVDGA